MTRASLMSLTAELVAKVQRFEPDDGPRPEIPQLDDVDFNQYTDELLTTLGSRPLRVFAYGSLIWKPEFEAIGQYRATLNGWHRSFCLNIERWRGTRAFPGLMMALDQGGFCEGVIYELPPQGKHAQVRKLLEREMDNKPPTNLPMIVSAEISGQMVEAIAFTANPIGPDYAGVVSLQEVAQVLARAAGHWGSCAEYLFKTVSNLEQLGIRDQDLWQLQHMVAEEIKAL